MTKYKLFYKKSLHFYEKKFIIFFPPNYLTWRKGNAVAFGVEQSTDHGQVALPLDVVLNDGGFHEERVHAVLFSHPVDALRVAARVHARLGGLHHSVQLLVGGDR